MQAHDPLSAILSGQSYSFTVSMISHCTRSGPLESYHQRLEKVSLSSDVSCPLGYKTLWLLLGCKDISVIPVNLGL